jgi:hypothetical protein
MIAFGAHLTVLQLNDANHPFGSCYGAIAPNAAGERPAKPVRSSGWFGGSRRSQVFGPQAGALRDPGQHARPDLLVDVKGEHKVGPSGAG